MVEVTTLFDSDEAEYEYMKEKERKERESALSSDYIDRAHYCQHICLCNRESCDRAACTIWNAPQADVAPRAEIAEEIFNEIAKMFSEKQRSYENSHQSGKARQMMVARFEVHKLHQKYKEAHNG